MLRRTLLSLVFLAALSGGSDRLPLATAVDSIGMTVSDLDRSIEFYTRVLGFEKVAETERIGEPFEQLYGIFGLRIRTARLRIGQERIELTEYLTPQGRPIPVDARSNDRSFQHIAIIVSDMDRAYAWLRQHKVRHASTGPQRLPDWNPNAGGIKAFYFRDPDGHALEILQFPEGKGDPKWHGFTGERLFLGIDHTAIVVQDTDVSLRFYRDLLGMKVAGESENYGPEQERLNNVFGARLRITALRATSGPGIELLDYLSPRDGRPYPADARPNDLFHWHTKLLGADVENTARALRNDRTRFISSGVVELPDADAGPRKSLLVRDPDGHAVLISGT
jgi:catechol 2,3-dioxygenase-like lactoylglutathione lyase family enzyme